MTYRPRERPRYELVKSSLMFALSLLLVVFLWLNGPPRTSPNPTAILALAGLVTGIAACQLYHAYTTYLDVYDQNDESE